MIFRAFCVRCKKLDANVWLMHSCCHSPPWVTMKNKLPISVCIIAGAEAARIGRCLASVAEWTSEVVVVINPEVADGTGRRLLLNMKGRGRSPSLCQFSRPEKPGCFARDAALDFCRFDADEVVSDDLKAARF